MRLRNFGMLLAAALLLTTPIGEAMAQRGGRGGGGGSNREGGGHTGGFSSGSNSGSISARSNRGDSGSQHNASNNRAERGQRSETFYRGPISDGSNRERGDRNYDRDGRSRDNDSSRNFFSNGNRERSDDGVRDRGSRGRGFDFTDRLRRDFGGYNRRDLPFRYGWWDTFGLTGYPNYSPWRYSRWRDRPYYWWGWSSPRGLTDWLVYGFTQPAYWSYGRGRNIWYQDDYVYYDGNRYLPADQYYTYIDDLARDVPKIDDAAAEKMDWKPLGVFAVRRENATSSDRTLQIAVNRDGVLVGTYFIRDKNEARPISGRVDQRSQRATWRFADDDDRKNDNDIVFETSVYNLTQDSTNVMVHFGPKAEDAEIWQLVRLETPEPDAASQTSQD